MSVVIVNWNTRDLLLKVIGSVLNSTHRTSLEIIVVDNGSTDGSAEAVEEQHPETTVIRNPANLGFAKANNIGFAAARGRALCLINTDVVVLDGAVDELWDYLVRHPAVALVGPRTYDDAGRVRQNCRRFPGLRNALGDHLWLKRAGLLPGRSLPRNSYAYTHPAEVLSGCFLMVRGEAFEEVGPLDEDFFFYGEDTDWGRRFHEAGWGCVYHPAAEAIHSGGGTTRAFPVAYYLTMEKADLLYWRKHHPLWKQGVYVVIRLIHNIVSALGWAVLWVLRPELREKAVLKVRGNVINTVWLVTRRSLVPTPGWD